VIDGIQITTNLIEITSAEDMLVGDKRSTTKFMLGGRKVRLLTCLNRVGGDFSGTICSNILDMLIASSSDKFPWTSPSMNI
jgi:hypothetical protein